MPMEWGKDWGPGFSFFKCEECGHEWKEKSRDCTSPSGSFCKMCHSFGHPNGHEMHLEWPVDRCKNLIE